MTRELLTQNIPACLRELPQWVCWRYVDRQGLKTKMPVNAVTDQAASTADPSTWSTFEAALQSFEWHTQYAGVAFVFSKDDPFCGIDMDRCLDAGRNVLWGQDIIEALDTYTEISPSGTGLKLFLRGRKPAFASCRGKGLGPEGQNEIEIYDHSRMFAVTGRRFTNQTDVTERQDALNALCARLWPQRANLQSVARPPADGRLGGCLGALLRMTLQDHNDGSLRLYTAACRCIEHDLTDGEALETIRSYERTRPFPIVWSDEDIVRRLRDAERECHRGKENNETSPGEGQRERPELVPVRDLLLQHPDLRRPVIEGLLRTGETMNIISAPKIGKSWLVTDLALAIATGRRWLDSFDTVAGNVLIIDNELHPETSANRIPKVAQAREIPLTEIADTVFIDNLRGRLRDIINLGPYFEAIEPNRFKIIILDAFYRFLPRDTDENDNASMASLYNYLDQYADRLGCSFVLIHHASKGSQTGRSVTDVGAGAGSQSRATDTHLILRPHEEKDCVVLEAAVRSWPPVEPKCLRWLFPVWVRDDSLDPTVLKSDRPRRNREESVAKKEKHRWTVEGFVEAFVGAQPKPRILIVTEAIDAGLSEHRASRLLKHAEALEKVHRWKLGTNQPVSLANRPQPIARADVEACIPPIPVVGV